MRKDVEFTFGIIKAPWRWLRADILYTDKAIIGYARTAAILHNILLRYGNLETYYTKTERFWNALDPDLLDRYAVIGGE